MKNWLNWFLPRGLCRVLAVFTVTAALVGGLKARQVIEVGPAEGADGYALDTTGDEHGDAKIAGAKVPYLIVGEASDTAEARAWIPFVLTEEQKAEVLRPGVSVVLRLFLGGVADAGGLRVDLYGAGYRTAYRVNQGDYATLRKKLVSGVFDEKSLADSVREVDVTAFVREEAARPEAAGVGFGFLLQVQDEETVPVADGVVRAFRVASSRLATEGKAPVLVIATGSAAVTVAEAGDKRAVRVLIIGNSILKNSPLPRIGWAGNWGMAASAPDKDFAHVLMARIEKNLGHPVDFMLHNMAFWENTWSVIRHDIPLVTYARDFEPDIIVSCISENTGLRDEQVEAYRAKYEDMIAIIAGGARRADVVVRGSFWAINGNTDLALEQAAKARGWPFVRCSDLGAGANLARGVTYYLGPAPVQESVLNHPSDLGMQAIADRIWDGGLSALLVRKYGAKVTGVTK